LTGIAEIGAVLAHASTHRLPLPPSYPAPRIPASPWKS